MHIFEYFKDKPALQLVRNPVRTGPFVYVIYKNNYTGRCYCRLEENDRWLAAASMLGYATSEQGYATTREVDVAVGAFIEGVIYARNEN